MIRNVVNLINPYDAGKFPQDLSGMYGLRESEVIQLGSNENPYPPSEEVKKEYEKSFYQINRYPHPGYIKLKEALSSYLGVDKEQITIGNGASDILRSLCEIVLDTMDRVVIPIPGYTLYAIFAMLRDASISFVEFPNYEIKAKEIPDFKLLFLCSPNNPTGNTIPKAEVMEILKNHTGYVVLDEAYVEFCEKTAVDLIDRFDNLIVVRSFSKFFGLAGLRIGYAAGDSELIKAIEKVRLPFCISSVASDVAIAALNSIEYYKELRNRIVRERKRLVSHLKKYRFLEVYPSEANFILIRINKEVDVVNELERRGIIVRNLTGLLGLEGKYIRISIGAKEENDKLIEALEELELG